MKRFFLFSTTLVLALTAYADDHEDEEGVLNKAPVVLSGITAIENFKTSFESNGAKLGSELVGFNSRKVEDEAEASVYNIPQAARLKDSNYDCHYHTDQDGDVEEAHCEKDDESEARDYTASQGSFTVAEFRVSAEKAVKIFKDNIADPKKIKESKFWRAYVGNEANIQVKFVWTKDDGTDATNFMHCHYHQHHGESSPELGCHRQRDAGPFQP